MIPKNIELANELLKYIAKYPEQRFWQAVSNWSGYQYLGYADTPDGENFKDLFHKEDQ